MTTTMRHTAISLLARAFGRLGLALMLACGALFLTLPAQAAGPGGHGGHGGHGGGHFGGHGGWHGGWGGGWGPWVGFWGWPYYPYAYYPDYLYPGYYPPVAPTAVVPQAPAAPAAAPAQSMWYYCDNPKGYYPYVQSCSTGWRQVPTIPPK
jgi:hypothetical protein